MIKINGVQLTPAPSDLEWILSDIDGEAERTADGVLHRDRIRQIRKLNLKFPPMSSAVLSALLKKINSAEFQCTFYDPLEGMEVTKRMYVGDRKIKLYNRPLDIWKDISFNFIEY